MTLSLGKRKRTHRAFTVIGVLLIVFGLAGYQGWIYWQEYQATHNPQPTISSKPVTHSTRTPDETELGEVCNDYRVAEAMPRKILIDAIHVHACVEQVDLDQNDAIAVPTNIHLAGYYVKSARPGSYGITIINGHAFGRYSEAVFRNLKDLKPRDEIQIQTGNQEWIMYEVVDVNSYSSERVNDYLFESIDGNKDPTTKNQLNLVSTVADFEDTEWDDDTRIIVRARLK